MSAHTPGPWELFEHSWSDSSICAGEKNSKRICSLSIYDEATEETQQELEREMDSNARLIAAAPDLLEALEELLYFANSGDWHAECPIELAERAIAKAKGAAHE